MYSLERKRALKNVIVKAYAGRSGLLIPGGRGGLIPGGSMPIGVL